MILYSDSKLITRFLALCGGNYHSCAYIACQGCPFEKPCEPKGFLVIADKAGCPVPLPLSDAAILFSEQPVPEECLARLTYAQFCGLYGNYLEGLPVPEGSCPVRFLHQKLTDTLYDW